MRYTATKMLLLPPKCASRFCDRYVLADQLLPGQVPALLGLFENYPHNDPRRVVGADWCRHIPLRHIPDSIKNGRTPVIMSRDPYRWYESWWKHMSKQDFVWNAYWGHCGQIQQVDLRTLGGVGMDLKIPRDVPPFKVALKDYIFGHTSQQNIQMAQRVNGRNAIVWGDNHLAMQAHERVGWWSHWMHYMASKEQGSWNMDARFILPDGDIEGALKGSGFAVSGGTKERVGADINHLRGPEWDDEMRSWVEAADGPTLNLVREQQA
jgi:hypothetical protein|tara:strand:+ start:19338 stop:20135 length:798 start_codon:yes stop_codon:yes gene_type:complete